MGEVGERYNVCSGQPTKLRDVISTLTTITGHSITVEVNPAFVRPNEIQRLSGSPTKLEKVIGTIQHRSLQETLSWMLENR